MKYILLLSFTLGIFQSVYGASSSAHNIDGTPSYDFGTLASGISRVLGDPLETYRAAAAQLASYHELSSEDDGLGVDIYERPLPARPSLETPEYEAYRRRILCAAYQAAEAKRKEEAEAYRRKILCTAYQAAEAKRKEEKAAACYRHQMMVAGYTALRGLHARYKKEG